MKEKIWWIVNVFWVVVIAALGIFVVMRKYDAAGVLQTPQLKAANLAILGVVLVLAGLCQALILYIIRRRDHQQTNK